MIFFRNWNQVYGKKVLSSSLDWKNVVTLGIGLSDSFDKIKVELLKYSDW